MATKKSGKTAPNLALLLGGVVESWDTLVQHHLAEFKTALVAVTTTTASKMTVTACDGIGLTDNDCISTTNALKTEGIASSTTCDSTATIGKECIINVPTALAEKVDVQSKNNDPTERTIQLPEQKSVASTISSSIDKEVAEIAETKEPIVIPRLTRARKLAQISSKTGSSSTSSPAISLPNSPARKTRAVSKKRARCDKEYQAAPPIQEQLIMDETVVEMQSLPKVDSSDSSVAGDHIAQVNNPPEDKCPPVKKSRRGPPPKQTKGKRKVLVSEVLNAKNSDTTNLLEKVVDDAKLANSSDSSTKETTPPRVLNDQDSIVHAANPPDLAIPMSTQENATILCTPFTQTSTHDFANIAKSPPTNAFNVDIPVNINDSGPETNSQEENYVVLDSVNPIADERTSTLSSAPVNLVSIAEQLVAMESTAALDIITPLQPPTISKPVSSVIAPKKHFNHIVRQAPSIIKPHPIAGSISSPINKREISVASRLSNMARLSNKPQTYDHVKADPAMASALSILEEDESEKEGIEERPTFSEHFDSEIPPARAPNSLAEPSRNKSNERAPQPPSWSADEFTSKVDIDREERERQLKTTLASSLDTIRRGLGNLKKVVNPVPSTQMLPISVPSGSGKAPLSKITEFDGCFTPQTYLPQTAVNVAVAESGISSEDDLMSPSKRAKLPPVKERVAGERSTILDSVSQPQKLPPPVQIPEYKEPELLISRELSSIPMSDAEPLSTVLPSAPTSIWGAVAHKAPAALPSNILSSTTSLMPKPIKKPEVKKAPMEIKSLQAAAQLARKEKEEKARKAELKQIQENRLKERKRLEEEEARKRLDAAQRKEESTKAGPSVIPAPAFKHPLKLPSKAALKTVTEEVVPPSVKSTPTSQKMVPVSANSTLRINAEFAQLLSPIVKLSDPGESPMDISSQPTSTTARIKNPILPGNLFGGPSTLKSSSSLVDENGNLPEILTDDDSDEDCDLGAVRPKWALTPNLIQNIQKQSAQDPDAIFGAVKPIQLEDVFKAGPSLTRAEHLQKFRARSSSGNWAGQDKLTREEQEIYRKRMGYKQ